MHTFASKFLLFISQISHFAKVRVFGVHVVFLRVHSFGERCICRPCICGIMPPQKRTPIDIWRKQEVIRWIDNEGGGVPTRAVKHFRALGWSIDGGAVRKWWRARDEILAADPKTRRLPGAGRKKTLLGPGASSPSSAARRASTASAPPLTAAAASAFHLLPMDASESGEDSHQGDQLAMDAGAGNPPTIAPLTPSERAVQLLQRRYSGKLGDDDIVEAFDVMLDPMKARIFLVMTPGDQRDLWLCKQIERRKLASSNGNGVAVAVPSVSMGGATPVTTSVLT